MYFENVRLTLTHTTHTWMGRWTGATSQNDIWSSVNLAIMELKRTCCCSVLVKTPLITMRIRSFFSLSFKSPIIRRGGWLFVLFDCVCGFRWVTKNSESVKSFVIRIFLWPIIGILNLFFSQFAKEFYNKKNGTENINILMVRLFQIVFGIITIIVINIFRMGFCRCLFFCCCWVWC